MSSLYREPSIDASYQVSDQLANCSNSGIFSHFIVIMKKRYIDFIQTTSILKYQYIW
jgi:hypothetical protein